MLTDHQECDVVVTAVAPVGAVVDVDGHEGFMDQAKHPSWWSDTPRPAVGDRMRAVVLDAGRTPPRLSALSDDIRMARALRHTAPLERLCPPPPTGAEDVEWAAVEEALGTPLPADYKRIVQAYGGGLFAGTLWLLAPGYPDAMYDLVAQTAEREEILDGLWEAGEERPRELEDRDVRLVPWGFDEGAGHFLYWLVRPDVEPEEWTVILNEGRGPLWEATPVSCSRFLLDVVAGTTTSFYFSDLDDMVDPERRYRFVPNAEILG
ncbi:SMI1/KNR4 family protein [Streptomyces triculaminicus]|uniref:SMI1/KNR4 family protein n=1 Tax=Streptomyces triculaminicus TaxID=2816232 RepID=UPI001F5F6300|nr:SMI1/KNR4 family protein [Streptomyces triculaminicus]